MAKQLEILTLILLRNAFKELALLPEPVDLGISNLSTVIDIAASGAGALSVFLCLGFYKRLIKRQNFLQDRALLEHYVLSKKILSLCMLVIFICIASHDFWIFLNGGQTEFFETIYTVLIFADIAMVLIAQRYMPSYYAVFRNSGYVIGTLMMRLSQSAPPLLCVAIAVFSGLYVLALTWSASLFMPGGNG